MGLTDFAFLAGVSADLMRRLAALVALPVLVSCHAGPVTNDLLFDRHDLPLAAGKMKTVTEKQATYFNHLCQRAGLGRNQQDRNAAECTSGRNSPAFWTRIVHQGLNDIDRRCDAYLEWLAGKKRNRVANLAQLGTTRNTVAQILRISSGASGAAEAIAVIGQVFELAAQGMEHHAGTLLMEVDQSSINSVVLMARHRFREQFSSQSVPDRPRAEYVLREYLRICLPFAIETAINNNSSRHYSETDLGTGFPTGIHHNPALDARELEDGVEFPAQAEYRLRTMPDFKSVFSMPGRFGISQIRKLQNALCLPGNGSGILDRNLPEAIKIFEETYFNSVRFDGFRPVRNDLLDEVEYEFIVAAGPCNNRVFRNFNERIRFEFNTNAARSGVSQNQASIDFLARRINQHLKLEGEAALPAGLDMGSRRFRQRIAEARRHLGATRYAGGYASDHVTEELVQLLKQNPKIN